MDHIDVPAGNRIQRASLVLAILKLPLLMQCQGLTEGMGDPRAELGRCLEREELQTIAGVAVPAIALS